MTEGSKRGPNITRVDERVRHFGPYGLMTDRALTDESAIAFNANRLDSIVVSETAPEAVREHLETLCELHRHGAFEYRFFALVVTNAQLGFELVLGYRFIEYYGGHVSLVNPATTAVELVAADAFDYVARRVRDKWKLNGFPDFQPMLGGLVRWALETGALDAWLDGEWAAKGARAVWFERTDPAGMRSESLGEMSSVEVAAWFEEHVRSKFDKGTLDTEVDLRNALAHRTTPFVTTPVDSARAIGAYASLVNALWPPSVATDSNRQDGSE